MHYAQLLYLTLHFDVVALCVFIQNWTRIQSKDFLLG